MAKSSAAGLKEKEETKNGKDKSKSNATTERNHGGSTKTEKEFLEAPKPIIGMSDERAKSRCTWLILIHGYRRARE
ncbi:hypothetical protein EMCG_02885 [[Emmonsia] crescens]|uniref:Uncharacterized protein n=1 Tax=[Emmonsia] crescens TaxID=73230 RepID=A0A0G2HY91_9EURO|nr:hypothetical protein EMCG_02885 [Emmonsia crescens UAMH 3008]